MKLDCINSWRKGNKQDDVIFLQIRLARLSLLDIRFDASAGKGRIIILNFGVSW